ncbi:hypothetical protein JKF63_01382 [Porcisia hertigi]|uniref:Uncharacterized protein n=1 Tax=Porcisia hertigi TaxID=2761500 RepID=A0A836L0L0_9TRYP|nr:hypothetical protein JKF63_01382 [Porcisia hertigi]
MLLSPSRRQAASSTESNSADAMAVSTMTTERQNAGLKSRERLRRDQARQLRQFPFLHHRVEDLHSTCERLEQELANSRQQTAAYRHEVLALRSLIKFTQSPELVAAAEEDAARHVMHEEVKELRCHVQRLQHEKELSLRQTEEACEAAEYYKGLCDQLCEGPLCNAEAATEDGVALSLDCVRIPQLNRSASVAALAASSAPPTATSIEEQIRQLQSALKVERARSSALEERVTLLQSAMTETTKGDTKCCTPARGSFDRWEERPIEDHTSGIDANRPHVVADDTCKSVTRLKRYVAVLRSENRLLTQRVEGVVARNIRYVKDIAALRMAYKRFELHNRQGS